MVLLDNLPGYPDNLMRGLDGRIWLGFTKPRSAVVDRMAPYPWLRRLTLRLPRAMWPVPPAYGHVIAFTESAVRLRVMAWFRTTEWEQFLMIRHTLLLEFLQVVEREGSSFAFPSRTVYHVSPPDPAPLFVCQHADLPPIRLQ